MAAMLPNIGSAQTAYDAATNSPYNFGWASGQNGGFGFGAWSFNQTQAADNSFTNAGQQAISSAGAIGTAWTLFNLSSSAGLANAGRGITGGLQPGQVFQTVIQNPSTSAGYFTYRGWDLLLFNGTDNNPPGDNTAALRLQVFDYFNSSLKWTGKDSADFRTSLTGPTTAASGAKIILDQGTSTNYSVTVIPLNGAAAFTTNRILGSSRPINYVNYRCYNMVSGGLNDVANNYGISSMSVSPWVSTIDSAAFNLREFNDAPNASLTVVSNYPSLISFEYDNVYKTNSGGFADRSDWYFSNNGGVSSRQINNSDSFTFTMDLTLTGDPISPRKEAGINLDNPKSPHASFIVNTDGHEFVAFGEPFRFFRFNGAGTGFNFNSGSTITMGITVFKNSDGNNAIIYFAKQGSACMTSPPLVMDNNEQGVIDGSRLGGYIQVVYSSTIATNSGKAVFQNIKIGPPDQDFDGVPDSVDACPGTPVCTVVDANGCSLDQLAPCAGPPSGGTWKNHGQYVSTLAQAVEEFLAQGLITEAQAEAILTAAAQSPCGSKK
jgi:hypothetical protein